MGSHGDHWLQCTWCGKWGKCLEQLFPTDPPPLTDVDGEGILCDPCYDREYPPHYDWLENMLQTKLGQGATETANIIADYAYQRCADYKDMRTNNEIFFASLRSSSSQ